MKNISFLYLIFTVILFSCKQKTSSNSRLIPEPDFIERLQNEKQIIDTLFKKNKEKLIVLAKLVDNEEPIIIKNKNFPENVETTFNILKDSLENIISISAFPYIESGDRFMVLKHYFDKDGNTFAFEKKNNFFDGICTEEVAYETTTEFYNTDFKLIDKKYNLVDKSGMKLNKDSCGFSEEKYTVYPNIEKYLKLNKIKNDLK